MMYISKSIRIFSVVLALNFAGLFAELFAGLFPGFTVQQLDLLSIAGGRNEWAIAPGGSRSRIAPAIAQSNSQTEAETAIRVNKEGIAHYQNGEWSAALASFEQALQIYQEIRDVRGEGYVLFNLGRVYEKLGRKEEALDTYWEVLQIADKISNQATFNAEYEVYCNTEFGAELWQPDDEPIDCLKESTEGSVTILFDEDAEANIIPPPNLPKNPSQ